MSSWGRGVLTSGMYHKAPATLWTDEVQVSDPR